MLSLCQGGGLSGQNLETCSLGLPWFWRVGTHSWEESLRTSTGLSETKVNGAEKHQEKRQERVNGSNAVLAAKQTLWGSRLTWFKDEGFSLLDVTSKKNYKYRIPEKWSEAAALAPQLFKCVTLGQYRWLVWLDRHKGPRSLKDFTPLDSMSLNHMHTFGERALISKGCAKSWS